MLPAASAAAQAPLERFIIAMAQHFIQERLMESEEMHPRVEFDTAFIHSQPRENLWVVVGGFMSKQTEPGSFTAAVLLECPDYEEVECWSLEKLSINGEIVLDRERI